MKVYVTYLKDHDVFSLVGTFTSREKALKEVVRFISTEEEMFGGSYWVNNFERHLEIVEMEIDENLGEINEVKILKRTE